MDESEDSNTQSLYSPRKYKLYIEHFPEVMFNTQRQRSIVNEVLEFYEQGQSAKTPVESFGMDSEDVRAFIDELAPDVDKSNQSKNYSS